MITYNLFRERKFKIDDEKVWMTPFQLAGAKYTDAQEAWDILKKFFYSEMYSNFKPTFCLTETFIKAELEILSAGGKFLPNPQQNCNK